MFGPGVCDIRRLARLPHWHIGGVFFMPDGAVEFDGVNIMELFTATKEH
jgi:hypothetical protein